MSVSPPLATQLFAGLLVATAITTGPAGIVCIVVFIAAPFIAVFTGRWSDPIYDVSPATWAAGAIWLSIYAVSVKALRRIKGQRAW